ncbi:MAG TPA: hypothetical protein VEX61_13040, partial [Burkholderiales bacterium]|nr:hypothetical protein [Burkholderiales bacterium]
MLFFAFDEEKATSAQLVALASDARFAASGENEQPLVRAAVAVVGTAFLIPRREDHLRRLGTAVAGDYAESPAKPQVLPDQLLSYCFFSDPMPPELGAGAVVLLPEPDPIPLDPGVVGLVVLPLELEPEPLVLLPDAPLPALPLRASRSHFSFSAPVRARHLLALLPDAPDAAPAEPEVPEVELSLLPEAEPLADGVL